jgi:type IV pilus biogenesis protein CpaD/CtpE
MNARHPIALVLAVALLAATAGCGRKDTNQVGTPADTPATGTTSSTMPGTPPASAASN